MYWADHAPPHFHASARGEEAVIEIATLGVLRGSLPSASMRLTLEWARLHRHELLENWRLCAANEVPNKIEPLP